MKIDRARFLMMTGALSGAFAAACAVAACSTATTSTPDAGASGDGGGGGGGADSSSGTDSGGGRTDSGTTTGDSGGDAADGAACDDTVGKRGACADFLDGGTGPDADAAAEGGVACLSDILCSGLLMNLKPGVAEKAINCIALLPTCEGTTTSPVEDCVQKALSAACPDTTGQAPCDAIAATCADAGADAGVKGADCTKITTGLSSSGRDAFVACMTESACSKTDPTQCLNNF
jgi:hypothetical protein